MIKRIVYLVVVLFLLTGMTGYCGARQLNLPKHVNVAVVIPEYISERPRPVPDPAAQTTLKGYLAKHGYKVIELDIDPIDVRNMVNNAQYAAEIARKHGVDVVIVGEANAQYAGTSEGLIVYRAIIEVKAIKATDGEVIFSTVMTSTGRDVAHDIAAKKALRAAGEAIGEYICGADKVKFSIAANVIHQENFPWNFPEEYIGWIFADELYQYFSENLPRKYKDKIALIEVNSSRNMNVGNDLGDLLRKTFGYLIFANIESIKSEWNECNVEYSLVIRYAIYNDKGEIIYKNKYVGEDDGREEKFCRGVDKPEEYYGSVFQRLLRNAVVDIYNRLLKPVMGIVDEETERPGGSEDRGYVSKERLMIVYLSTGEIYKGFFEGPFYVGENAFLIDPNKMKSLEYIGGNMFKVTMLDGTVIKGEISPNKLKLKTKDFGTLIIDIHKIEKIETEAAL